MTSIPSDRKLLLAAVGAGLVLRWFFAALHPTLSHDAAAFYLPNARAILEGGLGNWDAMSIAVPPLFSAIVAMVGHLGIALEEAALMVSMLSGALIVFPVIGIARHLFPGRIDVQHLSVLLAVLCPIAVEYSANAAGDAFYALCFALALWWGLSTWRAPGLRNGALFGAAVGCAYLVRPEALGLPVLLALGVLLKTIALRGTDAMVPYGKRVLLAGVVGFLVLLPCLAWNMCFVHARIGTWTLSPKAGVLQDYQKKGAGDVLNALNEDRTMTLHEERLNFPDRFPRFSMFEQLGKPGMLAVMAGNLVKFFGPLPEEIGVILVGLLAALGPARREGSRGAWLIPLLVIGFFLFSYSMFYVSRRFWLPYLPLILPWASAGFLSFRGKKPATDWIPGALMVVLLVLTLPHALRVHKATEWRWWGSAEESIGKWIHEKYGDDTIIVSAKGRVAWFAGADHLFLPNAPLEDIVYYMEQRGARLLVLDARRAHRRRPELIEALENSEVLVRVHETKAHRATLQVYRLGEE